jgi:hypothetical protein
MGRLVLLGFAASVAAISVSARQPDARSAKAAMQEKVATLKQSLAQNQAALKSYTWTETTQISLNGEVKKTEQKLCHYGPDGKVQKADLPGATPAQQPQQESRGRRGGALKQSIVKKKVGEMKDYMERVAALVHEYVPPNAERIQAVQAAGNVFMQPGSSTGGANLTFKNYLKQGDSVALGFDLAAKKIRSYDVQSYLDKPKEDDVMLAVSFASLPDGTNYPQQSVIDATGKKIQIKVTNSGYTKSGR